MFKLIISGVQGAGAEAPRSAATLRAQGVGSRAGGSRAGERSGGTRAHGCARKGRFSGELVRGWKGVHVCVVHVFMHVRSHMRLHTSVMRVPERCVRARVSGHGWLHGASVVFSSGQGWGGVRGAVGWKSALAAPQAGPRGAHSCVRLRAPGDGLAEPGQPAPVSSASPFPVGGEPADPTPCFSEIGNICPRRTAGRVKGESRRAGGVLSQTCPAGRLLPVFEGNTGAYFGTTGAAERRPPGQLPAPAASSRPVCSYCCNNCFETALKKKKKPTSSAVSDAGGRRERRPQAGRERWPGPGPRTPGPRPTPRSSFSLRPGRRSEAGPRVSGSQFSPLNQESGAGCKQQSWWGGRTALTPEGLCCPLSGGGWGGASARLQDPQATFYRRGGCWGRIWGPGVGLTRSGPHPHTLV